MISKELKAFTLGIRKLNFMHILINGKNLSLFEGNGIATFTCRAKYVAMLNVRQQTGTLAHCAAKLYEITKTHELRHGVCVKQYFWWARVINLIRLVKLL